MPDPWSSIRDAVSKVNQPNEASLDPLNIGKPKADVTAASSASRIVDEAARISGITLDAPTKQKYVDAMTRASRLGVKDDTAIASLSEALGGKTPTQQAESIFTDIKKANQPPKPPPPTTPPGGGVTPLAGLEATYRGLAATGMPKPEDYATPAEYQADMELYSKTLTGVQANLKVARELDAGITTLKDGTIITAAQYASLDPLAKAQVDQHLAQQNIDLENAYNATMNSLGLSQWTTARQGVVDENTKRNQDFANRAASTTTKIAYDRSNVDRAAQDISRSINGQQESRQRADYVTRTMQAAAPYATGGKTSFTGKDFGGLLAGLVQQAGLAPDAPIFTSTGNIHLDPEGLLADYDTRAGVSGPLPSVPQNATTLADIPTAPGLLDIPQGAPAFTAPKRPALLQMPAQSAPPTLAPAYAGLLGDDPGSYAH